MTSTGATSDSESDEEPTTGGRLDRELTELLNELRVVLPGVSVILAFLLTVPFSDRFREVTTMQRAAYYVAFTASAVSAVLLTSPTAMHRLRFRRHDKERILRYGNRMAIAGTVTLAIALGAAVFLVTDFVYDGVLAGLACGAVAVLITITWFVLPLSREVTERDG